MIPSGEIRVKQRMPYNHVDKDGNFQILLDVVLTYDVVGEPAVVRAEDRVYVYAHCPRLGPLPTRFLLDDVVKAVKYEVLS